MLGLGQKSILSEELIAHLTLKRIIVLALASVSQDPITLTESWISSLNLGITRSLAAEWECYCDNLNVVGVSLHDVEDSLISTGGDSTGKMTIKNMYATLISTQDLLHRSR